MRSNLKINGVTVIFLGTIVLSGCQIQSSNNNTFNLNNMFPEYKSGTNLGVNYDFQERDKLEYESFTNENVFANVKAAISNDRRVQAAISKVDQAKKEVDVVRSSKKLQASGILSGGAKREDDESEVAVVAQVSTEKLMYDFGATDASVDAALGMLEATKLEALIEAENVGLSLVEALIEYNKATEINKIFEEGMALAEPLLGQIKNISLSGIADKSSLLEAQEKFTRLEIGLEKSRSAAKISKTNFENLFQIEGVNSVAKLKPMQVNFLLDESEDIVGNNYELRRQISYKEAKILEQKSLEVGDSPSVIFATTLTAPAKDFSQDSVANAGFSVNYIFNDGGLRIAQIELVKSEIDSINKIQLDIKSNLKAQLISLNQEYATAKKTQFALEDLLGLSKELRDTSKAQLISGRSSVQEILSAEVKLAEIKIELITAEAAATLASYKFNAVTGELLNNIKWDLPVK